MLLDLFTYRQRALKAEGELAYYQRRETDLGKELAATKRQLERTQILLRDAQARAHQPMPSLEGGAHRNVTPLPFRPPHGGYPETKNFSKQ